MKQQLTIQEYRGVDLSLFALMLCASEYVITSAATRWFPSQPFTVSITAAFCAMVLMRWGAFAAIHAVVGGLVFCYASGAAAQQYLVYCLGNLGCLAALIPLRLGKETVRADKLLSMLFALLTLLCMQLGRAAVALMMGYEAGQCVGFFTTDSLSGLFAMVIIYIARNLDGIFEDQKKYLIRLQKQNEKVKGGF